MKDRADIKECINRLSDRLREIESKFNIKLSEEDRDLFMDLKRDIIVPIDDIKQSKGVPKEEKK